MNEIEKFLMEIKLKQEDEESTGVVFTKSGLDIFIGSFYNVIERIWFQYRKALWEGNTERANEIIDKNTIGGIITNGITHILIDDISAMMREEAFNDFFPDLEED